MRITFEKWPVSGQRVWTFTNHRGQLFGRPKTKQQGVKVIKNVIKSEKGMVMVFDENDEQIPEYQGKYEEVREKVLRDAPPDAVFGRVVTGLTVVPREEW